MIDLISIFSKTKELANADKTRKLVETGIPILVSNNKINGAVA
tara:strand:+ start:491 stop:619 length:129 start_codon:yes stop_codon:yes gene_type:complete